MITIKILTLIFFFQCDKSRLSEYLWVSRQNSRKSSKEISSMTLFKVAFMTVFLILVNRIIIILFWLIYY